MSFPKASCKLLHTDKPIIIGGIPTTNGPEEMAVRILRHPRRMCGLPLANTRDGETQMPDDAIPPAACADGAGDGSYFELYADIPNHGYGAGAICGGSAHASAVAPASRSSGRSCKWSQRRHGSIKS